MDTFEDLGLSPELVEALIAEGIETPTALQRQAIPLIRRGNSAVLGAGPGAGTLVAFGPPLLDRLDPGAGSPGALVLTTTRERASGLARSLGRLGISTGHRAAALGGPWALPGHADVLVATPADLHEAVGRAEVKVDHARALVIEGAGMLLEPPERAAVERALELLAGNEAQVLIVADPVTPTVRAFASEHLRRAVYVPSEAGGEDTPAAPVERGVLRVVSDDTAAEPLVQLVAQLLEADAHHVLVYFRSEDRAADAADLLGLHGFLAGSPGDPEAPVWVGIEPLDARRRVEASDVDRARVLTVSADVPHDADTLDRRHGGGGAPGVALVAARELPHLRRIAREAGYPLQEMSLARSSTPPSGAEAFRSRVEDALGREDLAAYLTLLEPLLARWSAAEVAAALAALLRRAPEGAESGPDAGAGPTAAPGSRPPAWTRLFLSVGSRDGVGPGDLLGAITGETGLQGGQVGRIDIRDTFSRVEVEDAHAERVIRALNGITIRGRSVRADFDRGEQRGGSEAGGRGSRGRGRGSGGTDRARGGRGGD